MLVTLFDAWVYWLASLAPEGTFLSYYFNVKSLHAVILVSLVCGAIGSLVVGNRMAFFSDALAHCAFAGVALGLFLGYITGAPEDQFLQWLIPLMVLSGIVLGLAIVFVREKTGQANDTVIAVFFAGAIGLGAVLLKARSTRRYLPPEDFLFGNLATVGSEHILLLFILVLVTGAFLFWQYNNLLLISFNPSLARSRGIPVRLCGYLFIIMLAVAVNLCLVVVGALLINALLIVPAAAAAHRARNLRQLFVWSIGTCVFVGILGQWLSWEISIPVGGRSGEELHLGEGGTIVVLAVLVYVLSMWWPGLQVRRRKETGEG